MGCSQVRRELLEHFAFLEELGPRSAPHLAHLESCAECRREMGIDRALVIHLRRALRERVDGNAPSATSWDLVRLRTVDRPARPWAGRVLRWGGMLPAVLAGIFMFATATAPETRILPGPQSPALLISQASRPVPPVEEAGDWPPAPSNTYRAPQADPPLPGWPMNTRTADAVATNVSEPPITGRMR